jgi:hypothetical protein
MNPRRHVYYITASDIQKVAEEALERRLTDDELERVVDGLLDKIAWYEVLEDLVLVEGKRTS